MISSPSTTNSYVQIPLGIASEEETDLSERTPLSYLFQNVIAKGDFAILTEERNLEDNRMYALKRDVEGDGRRIAHEGEILQSLSEKGTSQSKRVIDLITVVYEGRKPVLVLPFHSLSSLEKLFEEGANKDGLSLNRVFHMFHQMVEALSYLREKRIIHRDIKLANVLRENDQDDILLTDFEHAIREDEVDKSSPNGNLFGSSPEGLILKKNGYPGDMWGTARLISHLYLGKSPFTRKTKADPLMNLYQAHQECLGLYPENLLKSFDPRQVNLFKEIAQRSERKLKDLINESSKRKGTDSTEDRNQFEKILGQMFIYDPEKRPSPEMLLRYLDGDASIPEVDLKEAEEEYDILDGYRNF